MQAIAIRFRHPVGYPEAVRLQDALCAARIRGAVPDVVLLLEHRPVVTLGRRGRDSHLRVRPDELAARGIDFAVAGRGGDVTYHGPGQIVIYPILQLEPRISGAHGYLWQLEEIALRTASAFGVRAFRREGLSGAWTDRGKLAAVGFRIRRWVTSHGMSLNVSPDLAGFDLMAPCGLAGEPVTSLAAILGPDCPPTPAVAEVMARQAQTTLRLPLRLSWADEIADPEPLAEILSRCLSVPP